MTTDTHQDNTARAGDMLRHVSGRLHELANDAHDDRPDSLRRAARAAGLGAELARESCRQLEILAKGETYEPMRCKCHTCGTELSGAPEDWHTLASRAVDDVAERIVDLGLEHDDEDAVLEIATETADTIVPVYNVDRLRVAMHPDVWSQDPAEELGATPGTLADYAGACLYLALREHLEDNEDAIRERVQELREEVETA